MDEQRTALHVTMDGSCCFDRTDDSLKEETDVTIKEEFCFLAVGLESQFEQGA